jgi:hypothetical protein
VPTARGPERLPVAGYCGGPRRVGTVGGDGPWYESGNGPVPIRQAFVGDRDGTHRDESFFTTGPAPSASAIIAHDPSRWDIETPFQDHRCHPGLETARGRCRATAPRAAPCLFGLSTAVAAPDHAVPEEERSGAVARPGEATVALSGAVTAVRRWRRCDAFFHGPGVPRTCGTPLSHYATCCRWLAHRPHRRQRSGSVELR